MSGLIWTQTFCFDTYGIPERIFRKKKRFWKKSADSKRHAKKSCMQRDKQACTNLLTNYKVNLGLNVGDWTCSILFDFAQLSLHWWLLSNILGIVRKCINSLPTWKFCMLFCHLLIFFEINFFQKILSGTLAEYQEVWVQIRTGFLQGYQQTTVVTASRGTQQYGNGSVWNLIFTGLLSADRRFPYIPDNECIRTSIGFLNQ